MQLHDLPGNTFVVIPAGTPVMVVDPRDPNGQPFGAVLQNDRKVVFGGKETVWIADDVHALFEKEKNA